MKAKDDGIHSGDYEKDPSIEVAGVLYEVLAYREKSTSSRLLTAKILQIQVVDEVGKRRHSPQLFFLELCPLSLGLTLGRDGLAGFLVQEDARLLHHCLIGEYRHLSANGQGHGVDETVMEKAGLQPRRRRCTSPDR